MKYYEELRNNENGDEYVAIVNEAGDEVTDDTVFGADDELVLLTMPFDKDGRHATGIAIFGGYARTESGFEYPNWSPQYEGD